MVFLNHVGFLCFTKYKFEIFCNFVFYKIQIRSHEINQPALLWNKFESMTGCSFLFIYMKLSLLVQYYYKHAYPNFIEIFGI